MGGNSGNLELLRQMNELKKKEIHMFETRFRNLGLEESVIVTLPPLEDGAYIIAISIQPCGGTNISIANPYFAVSARDAISGQTLFILGGSPAVVIPIDSAWDATNVLTSMFQISNMDHNIEFVFTNYIGVATNSAYDSIAAIRLIKIN